MWSHESHKDLLVAALVFHRKQKQGMELHTQGHIRQESTALVISIKYKMLVISLSYSGSEEECENYNFNFQKEFFT